MRHALRLKTSPAKEPVSLAEAKLHLKIEATDTGEDSLIKRLIVVARRRAEVSTGRALVTQTWTLALDGFPGGVIEVPRPPLSSVTSITYIDPEGATQTVAADRYRVDAQREPGRLTPAWDEIETTMGSRELSEWTAELHLQWQEHQEAERRHQLESNVGTKLSTSRRR